MKRKQFIKTTIAAAGVVVTGKLMLDKEKIPTVASFTSNPTLKNINPAWKGTPLDQDGLFMNHEFPFVHKFGTVFKWMTQKNPQKAEKKADTWKLPVVKDDFFLSQKDDFIVWFGHATFFIQLNGVKILIDPVLNAIPATKRYSELPVTIEKLTGIDYILVSHAHYDHCDKDSIKTLAKQNPNATFLTGLKLNELLEKWIKKPVQAAGWYQQYKTDARVEVSFVPSRHWANRSIGDANETLWGGFVLKAGDKTIYFGGDSGYGSHFGDIGKLFPNINVAMIGAGAYSPRWFMSPNHQDPQDAVKAFHDTKAKVMIPFHYGTFDQADEPMSEPEKILKQLQTEGKIKDELKILKAGEVFRV
jgi:L-ascorbate metabolism protein UlaG (beta-lactamase superfamily)